MTTPRLCVIIPAYNADQTIGPIVRQIKELGYQTLVINDGSVDHTASVAMEAGAIVMSHVTNRGKGMALRTGFAFALQEGYDAIVTLDSDGQHDPLEIPKLLNALDGPDTAIIIGHRMTSGTAMPAVRRWTNRTMSVVISILTGQRIPDSQCGFRLIRRPVLANLRLHSRRYELESELLLAASRSGWKVRSVPIQTVYPQTHISHIRPFRDTVRFLRLILRYVLWPPPARR